MYLHFSVGNIFKGIICLIQLQIPQPTPLSTNSVTTMQFGLSPKQSNQVLHRVWVCKNLSVKHY